MEPFSHRSELVREAYRFAMDAHAGQVKDIDGSPYLEHLVTVARMVDAAGLDDDVVAAALLHDVVEHAGIDIERVRAAFGDAVASLVAAMTEPAGIQSWERRKRAHRERIARGDARARSLFAADKAANASSLRRALQRRGEEGVERIDGRVEHYRATLGILNGPANDPVAARLREELDRLAAERVPAQRRSSLRT